MLRFNIFVSIVITVLSSSLYASAGSSAMDFIKLSQSVRSESLGQAVTAAEGLFAVKQNPASIASVSETEINAQYLDYVEDISIKQFQLSIPTPYATVGFDIALADLGAQTRTTLSDPSGLSNDVFTNMGYHGTVSVARNHKRLSYGVGATYVSETLDSETATALGLNIGAQYSFDSIRLGASINNISLVEAHYDNDSAALQKVTSVGGLYERYILKCKTLFSTDIVIPSNEALYIAAGIHTQVMPFLGFNVGYNGYSDLQQMTIGIDLNLKNIQLDFAYQPMAEFGQNFRFGMGLIL